MVLDNALDIVMYNTVPKKKVQNQYIVNVHCTFVLKEVKHVMITPIVSTIIK